MLCPLVAIPFDHLAWIFEPNYDGLRLLACFDGRANPPQPQSWVARLPVPRSLRGYHQSGMLDFYQGTAIIFLCRVICDRVLSEAPMCMRNRHAYVPPEVLPIEPSCHG